MHRAIATITAETTRGVLTAPAAIPIIAMGSALAGTIATRGIRIQTRGLELAGTTAIQGTRTTTPETTVERDRSIKNKPHRELIL